MTFPGPVRSVAAPDGSGARVFYRVHWKDGGQDHPVFYDDGHGRTARIATVTRSMDVSWSSDGRRFYLEDYWGSDIADCYVLTRFGGGVTGLSLLKLIQHTPGRPRGDERPFRSHYYVGCEKWLGTDQVAGTVEGHTDVNPVRGFDHPFTYDSRRRRVTWRR